MTAKRRRAHDKLAALPGVRPVRRPVTPDGDAEFDLFYVRAGRKSRQPVVIIPGGPGIASVLPYRGLRRHATAAGLDVIMIEHRGVGLSRHDDSGADLPPEAITVEQVVGDVAAVLDDAGVGSALIYGTSYGTYIAAGVGVRHPDRVAAMVLDSPLLSARDIDVMRAAVRGLLWDGSDPDSVGLRAKMHRLVEDGVIGDHALQLAVLLYGYGGASLLDRQLDLLRRGRTTVWSGLDAIRRISHRQAPYRNEDELVGRIAFRELNFAGVPDGLPLDPSVVIREMYDSTAEFEDEPFDLGVEFTRFGWPTAVLSGGRDLTTPPEVARQVATLIPGAVLVPLPTAGHSVLDTRERAALAVIEAISAGTADTLPDRGRELDGLPANTLVRLAVSLISAAAAAESTVPAVVPRMMSRFTVS